MSVSSISSTFTLPELESSHTSLLEPNRHVNRFCQDDEEDNNHSSANTTISDPCLTNLEPLSSPPIPFKGTPPPKQIKSPSSKAVAKVDSAQSSIFSQDASFPHQATCASTIRVKRNRLVEVVPMNKSQVTESKVFIPSSSKLIFKDSLEGPLNSSKQAPSTIASVRATPSPSFHFPKEGHGPSPSTSPPSLSPISGASSILDTSFSTNLSDFSSLHSDIEELEEDILIKALNQKLPPSALDMFVYLRQKEKEATQPPPPSFASQSISISPPHSPNHHSSELGAHRRSPEPELEPSSNDLPLLSPLSIMGVSQLNHLAKAYGLLLDLHALHLNPVSLYTLPAPAGGWLTLNTLSDYQVRVQLKFPGLLGTSSFVIPIRQPQRQRSELNTLKILCPQQDTLPIQFNAQTLHHFMTKSCQVFFTLEPKEKHFSGFRSSVQKNKKGTVVSKAESQLRLLPLLKSANLQYPCEIPFFMDNSKFLGYLEMSIKVLPFFPDGESKKDMSSIPEGISSTITTTNITHQHLQKIGNGSDIALSENAAALPPHFCQHPAISLPLELCVSISDFIPIVPPNPDHWPLGITLPSTLSSTEPPSNPSFLLLSLKCPVTLEASPVPCLFIQHPSKGYSVDLNTLFSLPITLKQLSPWLELPLILEVKYHRATSSMLLGLAKLPLPHLMETFLLSDMAWECILPLSMQSECPVVEPISGIVQGYVCVSMQFVKYNQPPREPEDLVERAVEPTEYLPIAVRIRDTGGFPGLARKVLNTKTLPTQVLYKVQLDLFPESLEPYTTHRTLQTPWKSGLPQYQLQQTVQVRAFEPVLQRYFEDGVATGRVLCATDASHVIGKFEVPLHLLLRRSSGVNGWVPVQSVHDDGFGCIQLELFFKDTEKRPIPSCVTEEVLVSIFIQHLPEYTCTLDASVLGTVHSPLERKGRLLFWQGYLVVSSESLVTILNGHLQIHVLHAATQVQGICFVDTFELALKIRNGVPCRIHFRKEVLRIHDQEASTLHLGGYLQIESAVSKTNASETLDARQRPRHDVRKRERDMEHYQDTISLDPSSAGSDSSLASSSLSPPSIKVKNAKQLNPNLQNSGKLILCIQALRFLKQWDNPTPIKISVSWEDMTIHASSESPNTPQVLQLQLETLEALKDKALDIHVFSPSLGTGTIHVDVSVLARGWERICGWYHIFILSKPEATLGQALLEISYHFPTARKKPSQGCSLDAVKKDAFPSFLYSNPVSLPLSNPPIGDAFLRTPSMGSSQGHPESPWVEPTVIPHPFPSVAPRSTSPLSLSLPDESTLSDVSDFEVSTARSGTPDLQENTDAIPEDIHQLEHPAFVSVQGLRERAAAIEREIQMTLRQYNFMNSMTTSS